jgi:hypothetical protein
MSDEPIFIVALMADRELMPHEPIGESYRELQELNPDADLTVHVVQWVYYGPFQSELEAVMHAERVEGGVHRLVAPIVSELEQ